jgi:TPR repeat protein
VWSLLGAKLRLHNAAGFSCARSAALLALVILLSLPAAQSNAVARDAADQSQTSDANQPDYNAGQSAYAAGRFVEALRIWRPLAESGDRRAAFGLGLLYTSGKESDKTRRRPTFGTGPLPRRVSVLPSSTLQ